MEQSLLFERVRHEHHRPVRYHAQRNELHQMSAKLHCLYGKPILTAGRLRSARTYPYACSRVYDLRQYTEHTKWGPFMDDKSGLVDWEKVESVLVVLGSNIQIKKIVSKIFSDVWDNPFSVSWPRSYTGSPRASMSNLEMKDPYGVTGTWYRVRTTICCTGILADCS